MGKGIISFRHDLVQGIDRRQQAGNGGDGYNSGMIVSNPSIKFDPTNKAEGADVSVKNGDHVSQKAYWDAGGAGAKAEKYSKAEGGKAYSNGDQYPKAAITSPTWMPTPRPIRITGLALTRARHVMAGIGGDGGDHNKAEGGDIHFKASIESANLNDVLDNSKYFHIDDSGMFS